MRITRHLTNRTQQRQRLRYYVMFSSSVKGKHVDRVKEVSGSLMSFKSVLEYRAAGLGLGGALDEDKKKGVLDRLRK